jgi:CRP/FNR family cyclic AMP-dependent transcriptional regulator
MTDKSAEVTTACGIRDGAFLIEEGQKDDALHVITSGMMEAVSQTGGGAMVTLQVLREGDMIGEMGFIDGVEHSAGLRAMGNCELIRLDRASFEALLHKDPAQHEPAVRGTHQLYRQAARPLLVFSGDRFEPVPA